MKINKLFKLAAIGALTLGVSACSSDYLDLKPQATVLYKDAVSSSQGARLAVHGLCGSMYKQYSALYNYNWFNGEPWLSMYYGDVMGQDYISLFWFLSFPTLVNWTQMNQQSQGAQVAWAYCYELIAQANNVISFAPKKLNDKGEVMTNANGNPIPDFSGDSNPAEYKFRYAQALTFRAHAYSRLMQIYAPRWEDRWKNGEEVGTVPLRLEYVEPEGNLDCPLSTMTEVMDQIYYDLDQALELYEDSGLGRSFDWEPDAQIAMGIYARAALIRNDYETAEVMAHNARQGYELMEYEDYLAGFAIPTSEWMWTDSGETQGIYFASFGATYACNGAYPCLWGNIGAGAIDNELVKLSETLDQRTTLFFVPKNIPNAQQKSEFWSSACDATTMNINSPTGALHERFVQFAADKYNNVANNGWYPPYTYQGYPISYEGTTCVAQFGAQFKFWGTDGYSTSFFPFMRASEMLLIEAESAYMNFLLNNKGDGETVANDLLNQINAKRIVNYRNKRYTGQELLNQIKICRRLELWGEGFNWFDFKRWNEPIVRKEWVSGDTNSGNWPSSVAGTHPVNENRGWRWRIPSTEYNYNHAIDQAEADANE